jgi:hypothetical protein
MAQGKKRGFVEKMFLFQFFWEFVASILRKFKGNVLFKNFSVKKILF